MEHGGHGFNGLTLICEKQKQIKVYYNGQIVGEYFSDITVASCVIVELKAAESLFTNDKKTAKVQ